MFVCDTDHEQIIHDSYGACPLCEAEDKKYDLQDKINVLEIEKESLQDEVKELEMEQKEYEIELAELKDCLNKAEAKIEAFGL